MNNEIQKTIQMVQSYTSTAKVSNDMVINKISTKTEQFLNKLLSSTTEDIKEFLNKNTKQISLRDSNVKLYHYDNLLLTITDGQSSYNLEQNLSLIENCKIAPKFVKFFEIGQNEFLNVLEGDSSTLIPYSQTKSCVSVKSKNIFKSGLQKIADRGLVNKELFANREPLFYSEENGKIIYGDWTQLTLSESELKNRYKSIIDKFPL